MGKLIALTNVEKLGMQANNLLMEQIFENCGKYKEVPILHLLTCQSFPQRLTPMHTEYSRNKYILT